jgi:hypothetical protein
MTCAVTIVADIFQETDIVIERLASLDYIYRVDQITEKVGEAFLKLAQARGVFVQEIGAQYFFLVHYYSEFADFSLQLSELQGEVEQAAIESFAGWLLKRFISHRARTIHNAAQKELVFCMQCYLIDA